VTPWAALVRDRVEVLSGIRSGPFIIGAVAPRPRDRAITRELAAWAAELARSRHGRS